jgi:Uma2 family endonuclease
MAGDWYDPGSMHAGSGPRLPLPEPPSGDQIVVLHGIPWSDYDALCRAREDSAGPRMAYLDGSLEIMSPGSPHEFQKTLLARLLEAFAEETDLALNGFGSTTYRKKAKEAGVEPDECYCIGPEKPVPDLAIEVVHTSGGIDKLEVYRRLGVREVWFLIAGEIYIYRLSGHAYRRWKRSVALRGIDLRAITRILATSDPFQQTRTVRAFRRSLRSK